MRRVLVAASFLFILTACAEQTPAPAVSYGYAGGAASSGMHTVIGHETVWDIAQAYRLPMQEIIRLNKLQPPYALSPNQRIKLPAPHEYAAKPGDTIYSISRVFDVSPNELARMNNLREPYAMSAGRILRLPELPMPKAAPALPPAQTEYSVASNNINPRVTKRYPLYGDGGDARPLHPPVRQPVMNGDIESPQNDMAMQPVNRSAVTRENLDTAPVAAAPIPAAPVYGNGVQAESLPPQVQATLASLQPQRQAQPSAVLPSDTPARAGSRFGWPVNGPVLSAYGTKDGGLHNDGINIRAPKGSAVVAADNGVIVYADNQLKGYGNLVLVRHADRWMTAYAHMDGISVKRGQVVRKGERLGTVGATGGVSVPQLHFEVRHGTEALNPEAFMERQGT